MTWVSDAAHDIADRFLGRPADAIDFVPLALRERRAA
jgi:hypothetical protein